MDPTIFQSKFKETMQKAFYDVLSERVGADPPDYEWIGRLYGEIRKKLVSLLREGHPLRREIEDAMDISLFDQMIRNKAFDPEDMYKLINYVFVKCKQLGSPARDGEVETKKQEVLGAMQREGCKFKDIVPLFIKNSNESIDLIYEDLSKLSKNSDR